VEAAVDEVLEAAVPLEALGGEPGKAFDFHLEFGRAGGTSVRVPAAVDLRAVVPSPMSDWKA
jgi:hypothetical protein